MDVAELSIVLSQSSVQQNVNLALMKKTINLAEQNSQGIINMMQGSNVKAMEMSVHPHLGNSIDIKL
jgi:hypothetical protein